MHPKTSLFIALLPFLAITAIAPLAQAFNSDHLKQLLKSNQCSNCDLSSAPLEGTNLSGANLQNTNLSNANLSGTNLSGANLEGANLQNAILNNVYAFRANLTGTNFSNATLQNANLRETTLVGTNFTRADLRSVNLQGNNLGQALFPSSNLSGANLSQTIGIAIVSTRINTSQSALADFATHSICPTIVANQGRYYVSNLEDLNKTAEQLGFKTQTTDFTGVNMTDTNLENAVLMNSNLSNVDLTGANLRSACLVRVKLTGAKLDRTDWTETRLISTELPPGDFKGTIIANSQSSLSNLTKESEAKQSIGTLNRAQQAYYLENDRFTTNLESTGTGIKPDTGDYRYRLFVAPDRYPAAMQVGLPKSSDLLTFLGLVHAPKQGGLAIAPLCVSEKPGTPMPLWNVIDYKKTKKGEPIACPFGFTPVK